MQDTFWNFVFYKFIFVFGVMNVQDMREMLSWSSWFALVGALVLTSQLCKDRFQYVSVCVRYTCHVINCSVYMHVH